MIKDAKDLSSEQKAAIESLLGRRVLENESVSVRTFEPMPISRDRRQHIADELRTLFAEVEENRQGVSDEEAESIMTEAMRTTRPGYTPR